jgi:hypothetical protein
MKKSGLAEILAAMAIVCLQLDLILPLSTRVRLPLVLALCAAAVIMGRSPCFDRQMLYFAIPGGLFLLTGYFSRPLPNLALSDMRNVVFASIVAFLVGTGGMSIRDWDRFHLWLHRLALAVSTSGALFGLLKFHLLNQGIMFEFLVSERGSYPEGTSLHPDYNVYTLALFFGAGSAYWLLKNELNPVVLNVCHLAPAVIIPAALLTSSRRALVFLAVGGIFFAVMAMIRRRRERLRSQAIVVRNKLVIVAGYITAAAFLLYYSESLREAFYSIVFSKDFERISARLETVTTEEGLASRMRYWEVAYAKLQASAFETVLLGSGFSYIEEFGDIFGNENGDYPHNFVLSSMLYGGLVQTVPLLLMLAMAYVRLFRIGSSGDALLFWLTVQLLFLFSSSNSFFSAEAASVTALLSLSVPYHAVAKAQAQRLAARTAGTAMFRRLPRPRHA